MPRLNDDPQDFEALFRLWQQVQAVGDNDLHVDFSRCSFIRHNGVAVVGAIARLIESRGYKVSFEWPRKHVMTNLEQNGFAAAFGHDVGPWKGNSIPFRHDQEMRKTDIMTYLRDAWLGRGWVRVSDALANAIRGRVWEIYANAFDHSRSPLGTFTCGQHYPKNEQLSLCVVDVGVGIPSNVRQYVGRPRMRASQALEWAFQSGHTTKPGEVGRGLGLDILQDFVRLNDGRLDIYSDNAHARVTVQGVTFRDLRLSFPGTIVDIRLKCDESMYRLASEVSQGPLF